MIMIFVCIVCNHLKKSTKELLSAYRLLLNDKTHENLLLLNKQKTNLLEKDFEN